MMRCFSVMLQMD